MINFLTLTKPTSVALAATFFIHYGRFAALGADVTDLHGAVRGGVVVTISISVRFDFLHDRAVFLAQVLIQDLSDAVWQGAHAVGAKAE